MKTNNFIRTFTDYINHNRLKFFFVFLCLVTGSIIGSLSAISLGDDRYTSLTSYMDNFLSAYNLQPISRGNVFANSIYNNIKLLLFLWLSGIWIGFIPVGLIHLGIKGYKLGFTLTFLFQVYHWKGLLLIIVSLVPQLIFMIPILVFYMVFNMNFSVKIRGLKQKGHRFFDDREMCFKNLIFLLCVMLVMLICSLIDGFVIPSVLRPVSLIF